MPHTPGRLRRLAMVSIAAPTTSTTIEGTPSTNAAAKARPSLARNLVRLAACALDLLGGQLVIASPRPGGALLAVAAGALVATVVAISDDIAALFRRL